MRLQVGAAALLLLCASTIQPQDLENIQVERVSTGLTFAEGPVWSPDGYLILSDIPRSRVLRLTPPVNERENGVLSTIRADANGPIGNALDPQGRLVTCESHTRRVVRTDKKGKIEVLAERWNNRRLNSPNDLAIRHDGQIYFTDPAFGSAQDSRELDFYGIFHVTPKGVLSLVAQWKTRPKGIALSPDGKVLYVSDVDLHTVHAFDVDHTGGAANDRVLISAIEGVPLGIRTDEKGNLYVAAKGGVQIFERSGKSLGLIPTAETPSNCAWGDSDGQTLYITARKSVYRTHLDVKGVTTH